MKIARVALFIMCASLQARSASVDQVTYPDAIIYNAKIVTVSNPDFTADLGGITQALAVRGGKIIALGSNSEMQSLAGPQTKRMDLKGKTVLPGLIATHAHLSDWIFTNPWSNREVVTDKDIVSRYLEGKPSEILARIQPTLAEAVSKAKPGQWVRIFMYRGKMKEYSPELVAKLPLVLNKQILDSIAPNNPVEVKGAQSCLLNTKAIEELVRAVPGLGGLTEQEKKHVLETGEGGPDVYRLIEPAVIFGDKFPLLVELMKREIEYWNSVGMTSFSATEKFPSSVRVYKYLDDRGEMNIRHGWAYKGSDYSHETLSWLANMVGTGTDHLWFSGARANPAEVGGNCSTLQPRPGVQASSPITGLGRCNFAPGSYGATTLYNVIHSGLRIGGGHTWGDKDLDYMLDIIEKASKDAGFTPEQVRAKRHVFDHGGLGPRPDQAARMSRMGMVMSAESGLLRWYTPEVANLFGEEATSRSVPRKTLIDNKVIQTYEDDSPLSQDRTTIFEVASLDLTRRANDGKVHGANQRIDREHLLKVLTTWGSYYQLREKQLGSLEAGKFADFIVVDRDFLTVPEEQISQIQVLLTSLGGEFVYVAPAFASEYGLKARRD